MTDDTPTTWPPTAATAEVTAKLRKVIEATAPDAPRAAFSRSGTGAEVVTYTSGTRYLTLAEAVVAGYVVGWQLQEGNNAGGPELVNTSLVSWAFLLDEVEEALDTAEAAARRLVA